MPPKRKSLKFCQHCNQLVSQQTYSQHKRKYPAFFSTETSESIKRKAANEENGESNEKKCKQQDHRFFGVDSDNSTVNADQPLSASPQPSGVSQSIQAENTPSHSSTLPKPMTEYSHCEETVNLGSYIPHQAEFNFKHGYGVFDSNASNPACNQVEYEDDTQSLFSDIDETHPAFDEIKIPVDPREKNSKYVDYMQLQLLFLACSHFAQGMSDHNIDQSVKFMSQFLAGLGAMGALAGQIVDFFPKNIARFKEQIGITVHKDTYSRKVICQNPTCCTLYEYNEMYTTDRNNRRIPKRCTVPIYKYNKLVGYCDTYLSKTTYSKNGSSYLIPVKSLCYQDLTSQIEKILSRPGYEEACQRWRKERLNDPDVRKDIHSGKQWTRFETEYGFFKSNHDLALQFNVDWFKPYKHSNKSVGVVYLVICNLPREIRYKRENILIYAIVPSLDFDVGDTTRTEPEKLQTILKPMVDELNVLWKTGAPIKTHNHPEGVTMKAALLMVACDSPAARKAAGFLAHSALKGCTRCTKIFKGGVTDKYYGEFKKVWPSRDLNEHRKHVDEIKAAKNNSQKSKLESKHGCRDSIFNELPYFDVIRQTIIDPMHCLFLGTAKSFFYLLVDKKYPILTPEKLTAMNQKMEDIYISGARRWIPRDIKAKYSYYNSYQWKEWTLSYSLIALQGVIPDQYVKVWCYFVEACNLIVQPVVSMRDTSKAMDLFRQYGTGIEKLFGRDAVKPNQHMQTHLDECIDDFGSPYAFWLFAFERYNGELGDMHTNSRHIEVTLMRKFIETGLLADKVAQLPSDTQEQCSSLISKFKFSSAELPDNYNLLTNAPTSPIAECEKVWPNIQHVKYKFPSKQSHLDSDCKESLHLMYRAMYRSEDIQPSHVMEFCYNLDKVSIGGTSLSVTSCEPSRHCMITAKWPDSLGLIDEQNQSVPKVGRVHQFIYHKVKLKGEWVPHVLCSVSWKKNFEETHSYSKPCEVYRNATEFRGQPSVFMPVQRILDLCSFSYVKVNGSPCIAVIPHRFHMLINDNL